MTAIEGMAIVAVGIDFPEGPLEPTTDLVRRAIRFGKIAHTQGIPSESIFFAINGDAAQTAEASAVGRVFTPDYRGIVEELVPSIRQRDRLELVVIYWAGHGMLNSEGLRCLMLHDFAIPGMCITTRDLIGMLLDDDRNPDGLVYENGMIIAEACADLNSDQKLNPVETGEALLATDRFTAIYASPPGATANPDSGFSDIIMNDLEKRAITEWWDLRLDDVDTLYEKMEAVGQAPSAIYADVRGQSREFPRDRLRIDQLPADLFVAYRIDPGWYAWEPDPVPVTDTARVRLDVLCIARKAPFYAIVADTQRKYSFAEGLPVLRRHLVGLATKDGIDVAIPTWRFLLRSELRTLHQTIDGRDVDRSGDGVLLLVRHSGLDTDWPGVWRLLRERYRGRSVIIQLEAETTLLAVHAAAEAAAAAGVIGLGVEVYSLRRPMGPPGAIYSDRVEPDVVAMLTAEMSRRRAPLQIRGRPSADLPPPRLLPETTVRDLVAAIDDRASHAPDPAGLLRQVRENLPELWQPLLRRCGELQSAAALAVVLAVAAEIQDDLALLVEASVADGTGLLSQPRMIIGWLDRSLVDRIGVALHRLEKNGNPLRDPCLERAQELWSEHMTSGLKSAMGKSDRSHWDNLTVELLILLLQNDVRPPTAAGPMSELVRWLTIAQVGAGNELLLSMQPKEGKLAASIFDSALQGADPVRDDRLARVRFAVRPRFRRR